MNRYQRMGDAYIEKLAHEIAFLMGEVEPAKIKLALGVGLTLIHEDISKGEVVPLPHLGEFSRMHQTEDYVGVRYRVDISLLNRAQALAKAEAPPADTPIEDWPLEEDHRFQRSEARGA